MSDMTDEGDIEVACECGYISRGRRDDVVAETKQHGKQVHNMDVSTEQVLAMSRPAAP